MKRFLCTLLTLTLLLPFFGAGAGTEDAHGTKVRTTIDYIRTNSDDEDKEYIVTNTSQTSSAYRWCDGQKEIVYCFDLAHWYTPLFRVQLSNNYLLQASADGVDFTTVADYGALSGKVFDGSYQNTAFYTIDPADHQCTEKLYLRIANCQPSGGWGGAISSISVFYQVAVEPSDDVALFGDINDSGKVDASDALLALQHSVKLTQLKEQAIQIGDLNLDSAVDASDALQILQISVGLIDITEAEQAQNAVIHSGDRILFVGDSVTDANRNYDVPDDMGEGYVAQIKALLSFESSEYNLTFVNRGLNGTRTHDWLPRINSVLEETKPDVVSVALGVNDTWRRYDQNTPCSAQDYADNLRTILSAAQKTGAELVVISPFALSGSSVDITGWHEEDLNDKIAMCEQVAKEFDAVYIPMNEIFYQYYEGDSSYTWDGIHPNASGAMVMAAEWIARVPFYLSDVQKD